MSRTIRLPEPAAPLAPSKQPRAKNNRWLLASVAGEEDPGAAVDAPAPPPREPLSGEGAGSPDAPRPDPSRPSRSS